MSKRFYFLLLFLAATSQFSAQPITMTTKIDSVLSGNIPASGPGAVILVAKQGKIVYHKAAGMADIQLGVPMKPGMVFQLASITKQFTAIAILQLMEAGKLKLTDKIQQYLPDYPSQGAAITIEHLLTHTSGIPDYMQISFTAMNMERWDFTPQQLIDSFKIRPLQFAAGSAYRYSNSGYYILGFIIAKVSGVSYPEYVTKHIIEPLGLTNTALDLGSNIIPGRVQGYQADGKNIYRADYWSPAVSYSAGDLLSNAEDLLKWNEALKAYTPVRKETLEKAWTQYKLLNGQPVNYGYGWSISADGDCIYHTGAMNGFLTQENYYPKEDVYIVVLCNSQQAPRDKLVAAIEDISLGKQKEAYVPADAILANYIGTYKLVGNGKRTITIAKEKGMMVMKPSGQQPVLILFDSDTAFRITNVADLKARFESENGVVKRLVVEQNGSFIWEKQ